MPLRQIYPDPDRGLELSEPSRVDIIAVHGLNWRGKPDTDHAWDTWRTPDGPTGHLWLREELPRRIPDSRIFLYEWNSSLLVSKARDGWTDKARELLDSIVLERRGVDPHRPIIFFGHSMGGLLIKQTLVNASIDPFYWPIRDATSGIAFFATPHRGARQLLISLGGFATRVARKFRFQRSRGDLIKVLDGTGMFEDLLQEQWKPHMLRYNIVSFWGSKDEYVPDESSRFNLPREREAIVMLNADHRGVCKFQPGDPIGQDNLKLVLSHVWDLYKKARVMDSSGDVTAPLDEYPPDPPILQGGSARIGAVTLDDSIGNPSVLLHSEVGGTSSHNSKPVDTASRTPALSNTATQISETVPASSGYNSYGTFADNGMSSNSARDREAPTTVSESDMQGIFPDAVTAPTLISTITEGSVSPNEIWTGLSGILAHSEDEAFESMLLMGSLRKSVTPEIASLWVKTCISAGALGLFTHDLEVLKARLSETGQPQLNDISEQDLQVIMHQTLALHHLNFLASSASEALAAIGRRKYPQQYDIARNKVILGGGVLLSSLAVTGYFISITNHDATGSAGGGLAPNQHFWPTDGHSSGTSEGGFEHHTDVGGVSLSTDYLSALGSSLAAFTSLVYAGYNAREMSIRERKKEAILELDLKMHELKLAIINYEAVVAVTSNRSILKTANQGQSELLKSLLENLGIDIDHLLENTTYSKHLFQDRLDKTIHSFQRFEKQALAVAKVLNLPTPKVVVAMSKFGERASLLRNVTRGGLVAGARATQLDTEPEPESGDHVARIGSEYGSEGTDNKSHDSILYDSDDL